MRRENEYPMMYLLRGNTPSEENTNFFFRCLFFAFLIPRETNFTSVNFNPFYISSRSGSSEEAYSQGCALTAKQQKRSYCTESTGKIEMKKT